MSLELAEQSIQLLTCHISRWRLCHRSPHDNQSKSWKEVWPLFFLSLITSHAISTSRAEHTTFYRGRATTSFISYHQLKTWSMLSKENQSWEKMWAKKTEIVIIHHKTTNPSLEKKCDLCFFCHWSLLRPLAPAEQSIQLLIGAEHQLLLYHTIN